MFNAKTDWYPKQKELRKIIRSVGKHDEAIKLCLELHAMVHFAEVSGSEEPTFADEAIKGLPYEDYAKPAKGLEGTLAWNVWHIARIEDVTVNRLINSKRQVIYDGWLDELDTMHVEVGDSMSEEEKVKFSEELDIDVLFAYRNAVGKQTREILKTLTAKDMRREIAKEDLNMALIDGTLVYDPKSMWLLKIWSGRDVADMLLMSVTRHQEMHVTTCRDIKEKLLATP